MLCGGCHLRLANLGSSRSAVRWGTCASLTSLGLHNSASDCLRLARIHSTQDGLQSSLDSLIKLSGSTAKIKATKSRTAATTFIAKNNPESSQIVADFMQHEASIAEKFYRQHGGGLHFSTPCDVIGRMNTDET